MSYPSTWHGSDYPDDKSGSARFTVVGETFYLAFESFADYQKVSRMLDIAFADGKYFAAIAMRSKIERAMSDAEREQALAPDERVGLG